MAKYKLKLPKMGESVEEATLTAWLVDIGDTVEMDDGVLEVSTDKVDTELPSEVSGVLIEKLFEIDAIIKVGQTIAIIETEDEFDSFETLVETTKEDIQPSEITTKLDSPLQETLIEETPLVLSNKDRFYSPLVKSIAQKENIAQAELNAIKGTGKDNRLTKEDLLTYLNNRENSTTQTVSVKETTPLALQSEKVNTKENKTATGDIIIPMDRMGKLIAKHMVHSIQTSAHVQSFIEIDVTSIVKWRNSVKDKFLKDNGEKITFTPIFMQAIAQCIKEFPMVNVSVDGTNVILKKDINLGMAAALPDGNLIVPVIKNADDLSLIGMVKKVNSLALKARNGKLLPDEIQGGTYTVTNVGSFGSITGTPIINQPQVAILALGAVRKMPAVIETPDGDFIGIRHKMIVAHSYDHRVVNGALGGQFIFRLKQLLENFDSHQKI